MRLVVLGATGGVGLEIVRQAIARNHHIKAFVRSAARLRPFDGQIDIDQGDLLNPDALEQAIRGCDAIVSGFGPRLPISKTDANLLRDFAAALTQAMRQTGVRRVIVVSTAFLFRNAIIPPAHFLGHLLFPGVVTDATAMERIFLTSGVDWTLVRPPQLTDKAHTGRYRVRDGRLPLFGFKISRADVADCCLRTVEDSSTVRKILGVSR
ncbi:MAG TPA: NAD(P)H-binding protein [Silvibacterium sp.]|nr:NAD(P)H-binding protein [Silvibacterium sp.]